VDAYEIQVYDGSANDPGHPGIELHANRDNRARETHLTLEPSLGITRSWELGAYLQTAFVEDGSYHYEGVKLRSKHVFRIDRVRVGANFEIAREPDGWGGEIRPILAWEGKWLALAVNPIVSFDGGPAFEPAGFARLKIADAIAIGPEYYGSFATNEHYVFETIDLIAIEKLELQFGLGQGLSPDSHPLIGKMIAGVTF